MADQKLRELTETTDPISTDLVYAVVDPDGTPLDRKVEIGTLLGMDGAWINLVKNSPGQIVTDGVEPQWWDDVADAAITDEDADGESIPDKDTRVFKVVTSADDVYGYQTFTLADETLLDAGQTVISVSCWVYCASANKASIGIYGTNLGLQESSQHPGDSTWRLLKIENIPLHASDASIQLRLIVDTGTAYFTKPMLNIGSKALPWLPRGIQYHVKNTQVLDGSPHTETGAWVDLDCKAATHPLAVMVRMTHIMFLSAVKIWWMAVRPNYFSGGDTTNLRVFNTESDKRVCCQYEVPVDDDQVFEYYSTNETDATTAATWLMGCCGYWRWAP